MVLRLIGRGSHLIAWVASLAAIDIDASIGSAATGRRRITYGWTDRWCRCSDGIHIPFPFCEPETDVDIVDATHLSRDKNSRKN